MKVYMIVTNDELETPVKEVVGGKAVAEFLNISKELIWPIILVLFGLFLLADALRKPKKPRFKLVRNGKKTGDNAQTMAHSLSIDEENFECSLSFGEAERLITMPRLSHGEIECSFGNLTVDLSGCEEIANHCHLEADCSFGEVIIKVPAKYRVKPDSDTSFGDVTISGHPDAEPAATILLDANASFGSITVMYI
jgi:predicted membrane protein